MEKSTFEIGCGFEFSMSLWRYVLLSKIYMLKITQKVKIVKFWVIGVNFQGGCFENVNPKCRIFQILGYGK